MLNSYTYSKNYISELETLCILLIEKELDMFFYGCMKSAHVYSFMISKNLSLHDKKAFEELVLSSQAIKVLIENITLKINKKIEKNINYLPFDKVSSELFNYNYYSDFLKDSTENFKVTQMVTKICKKIIDSSISRILDGVCPNDLIKDLLKKVTSSKKILDKHNIENQTKKHQEIIYKQIEGLFINTKINLRNELIKASIICINSIEDIYELASIA